MKDRKLLLIILFLLCFQTGYIAGKEHNLIERRQINALEVNKNQISEQISMETIQSPDGNILIGFDITNGVPSYKIEAYDDVLIESSRMGFVLKNESDFTNGFVLNSSNTFHHEETWTPVWGENSQIENNYNELAIELIQEEMNDRTLIIYFRAYDDGVAFRYEFPEQDYLSNFTITSEETRFIFTEDATCWWVPDDYDSYEHLYSETSLSEALMAGVNTPMTCRYADNLHFSIHEAALTDFAGMTLANVDDNSLSAKAQLVPYYNSEDKVIASTPFKTPWRTIQISDGPNDLIGSNLIQNLNDPSVIEDTDWIEPMTYMGVWWGMHINYYTWYEGAFHGATTSNVEDYIDTCAKLNCGGVLVEGWNTGWKEWTEQNLTNPTSDYDIDTVTNYANSKGVEIIGHLETGGNITNYLKQGIDEIFNYYVSKGIKAVKTGYAGILDFERRVLTPDNGQQHHHGQYMVKHYREVLISAAEHGIMVDVHEPIKPTGIERTYPNMMTREGMRGMEYNAWGTPPNNPKHTTLLPYTRLLAGPGDYTPGIFNFKFASQNHHSTLAHQLALYITIHSPFQMMADLAQSYHVDNKLGNDLRIETTLIKDIPTSWDETRGIAASLGDYTVIGRRSGQNWYVGATTNEESRKLDLALDFLDNNGKYYAIMYLDASQADYEDNPDEVSIYYQVVTNTDILKIELQRGGGAAIQIVPEDQVDFDLISSLDAYDKSDDKGLSFSWIMSTIALLPILVIRRRKY